METGEFKAGKTKARRPLSCISAYRVPCLWQVRLRAISPREKSFSKLIVCRENHTVRWPLYKVLLLQKIPLWVRDDLLVGTLWRCKKSELHAMVGKFKIVYLLTAGRSIFVFVIMIKCRDKYTNIYPTRCNVTQFILSGNCSTCFGW